jgi:large subunit ribosomal protein L35
MPKLKSRRAAMKRYRFTASGRVKFQRPGKRHNLHQKSEKRKRGLKGGAYLTKVLGEKADRQLPYGSR